MAKKTEPTLVEALRDKRSALTDGWEQLITAREAERTAFEGRLASDDNKPADTDIEAYRADEDAFKADSERREADIKQLDERIRVQEDIAKRKDKAAKAARSTNAEVTSEPLTYARDNREHSYFRDLAIFSNSDAAAALGGVVTVPEARDRLFRHAAEMDVEMPKRSAERDRRAQERVEAAEAEFRRSVGRSHRVIDFSPFERRVSPSRVQGQGGYFVPPLWLQEFIPGLRAGRVAAGLPRQMDLPQGTDSINVPKLSTLTQVGIQGADNAPVASVDFTDTAVTANIKTLAGQEDIPLQLLEQSPYNIDDVLLSDLMADYNKRLDLQVIQGNGLNSTALNGGQVLGIYPSANWTGTNGVTYTNGAPAPWHMFSVFGAMHSQVVSNRFLTNPSFGFLVHPRRGFWFASGSDSNNRPLIESRNFGPFNVEAIEPDSVPAEGVLAQLPWGPRVYIDANVPTADTTGGGSGQDVGIGALWDDVWLFEGEMRSRVLPEVLSGTLAIRLQVYNYIAMLVRYGQSLAVATGSGFAAPTAAAGSATTF